MPCLEHETGQLTTWPRYVSALRRTAWLSRASITLGAVGGAGSAQAATGRTKRHRCRGIADADVQAAAVVVACAAPRLLWTAQHGCAPAVQPRPRTHQTAAASAPAVHLAAPAPQRRARLREDMGAGCRAVQPASRQLVYASTAHPGPSSLQQVKPAMRTCIAGCSAQCASAGREMQSVVLPISAAGNVSRVVCDARHVTLLLLACHEGRAPAAAPSAPAS